MWTLNSADSDPIGLGRTSAVSIPNVSDPAVNVAVETPVGVFDGDEDGVEVGVSEGLGLWLGVPDMDGVGVPLSDEVSDGF